MVIEKSNLFRKGYLYIAGTNNLKFITIGFSGAIETSIGQLNSIQFCGVKDWEPLYHVKTVITDQLRHEMYTKLACYSTSVSQEKQRELANTARVYKCNIHEAIQIVRAFTNYNDEFWFNSDRLATYDIPSKKEVVSSHHFSKKTSIPSSTISDRKGMFKMEFKHEIIAILTGKKLKAKEIASILTKATNKKIDKKTVNSFLYSTRNANLFVRNEKYEWSLTEKYLAKWDALITTLEKGKD